MIGGVLEHKRDRGGIPRLETCDNHPVIFARTDSFFKVGGNANITVWNKWTDFASEYPLILDNFLLNELPKDQVGSLTIRKNSIVVSSIDFQGHDDLSAIIGCG